MIQTIATVASTCATGAWTNLISISYTPASVRGLYIGGGFWFSTGTTLGELDIRFLIDAAEASGATRRLYPATKSQPHFIDGYYASHVAAASHLVTLQYSAAQAFTIYDRQLTTEWG